MKASRHYQGSGNTAGVVGAVLHVLIVVCGVIGLDVWLIYSIWLA